MSDTFDFDDDLEPLPGLAGRGFGDTGAGRRRMGDATREADSALTGLIGRIRELGRAAREAMPGGGGRGGGGDGRTISTPRFERAVADPGDAPGVRHRDRDPATDGTDSGRWGRGWAWVQNQRDPTAALMMMGQAGQALSGPRRYFQGVQGAMAGLDWAATLSTQMGAAPYTNGGRGGYNRFMVGGSHPYGNVMGWNNAQDLAGGATLNASLFAGDRGRLSQIGRMAVMNPNVGFTGTAQAYAQMFTPQNLQNMVPFGGGAVANGGRLRSSDEMLSKFAMTATGTTKFGAGGLTTQFAQATFGANGQGRANLRQLGVPEEIIDMIAQYSVASAKQGRGVNLDSDEEIKRAGFTGSFEHNLQKRNQRTTERDVDIFESSRGMQETFNDAVGRFSEAVGDFVKMVPGAGNAFFGTGVLGGAIGSAAGLGQSAFGLGMMGRGLHGLMRGGGPGPGPGGGFFAGAGRAAGLGAAGLMAGTLIEHAIPNNSGWQRAAGGAAQWGLAGAGVGAMLGGGVFSAPGAAIGGALGAAAGGIAGYFGMGDAVVEGVNIPGDAAGLSGGMASALAAMIRANPRIRVTSGHRSNAEQRSLFLARHHQDPNGKYVYEGKRWARNPGAPPTAVPGTSKHEKGTAADLGPESEYGWIRANVGRFGLSLPMPGVEPWHVEVPGGSGGGQTSDNSAPAASAGGSGGGGFNLATSGGLSPDGLSHRLGRRANHVNLGAGGGMGSGVVGAGGTYDGDLVGLLKSVGFEGEGLRMAYAIAMAESGGRAAPPDNVNTGKHAGSRDRGLFQINDKYHEFARSGNVYDARANAEYAFKISGGGKNWDPWSTYDSGAYRSHYNAGIGDAVGGGSMGVGGGMVVHKTVRIENFTLKVVTERISDSEARRLGLIFKQTVEEDSNLVTMASG